MNRRNFIKSLLLIPAIPTIVKQQYTTPTEGLVFPMVFSENSNKGCTSKVSISNFKSDNFFEKLWQDLSRIIK